MSNAPLTPPDCDIRDYPRMMVDIKRLFDSEFNTKASGQPLAWMVGHKLWYRAFHQFPGGSLPAEDADLCVLAELGMDTRSFKRVRPIALRGWAVRSDGRLYHPYVAEVVLEVWVDKLLLKLKSGAGNSQRHKAKGYTFDPAPTILSLETAGVYLATLNPASRGLEKIRRRSERAPTGSALGAHSDSESAPSEVRVGSQVKVEVEVKEERLDRTGAREPLDQARRAQVASLQVALLDAGGDAIADMAAAPAIANLSPILNLLEPGDGPACDLERDVLPIIRQRCARARARSVKSWNFFVAAICDARDARVAGAPSILETPHDSRTHGAAYPTAGADTRRANTVARRDAWDEAIAERRGPPTGRNAEPPRADGSETDGPGHLRLAYVGQP